MNSLPLCRLGIERIDLVVVGANKVAYLWPGLLPRAVAVEVRWGQASLPAR